MTFRLRCFALALIGLLGIPLFAWLVLLSIGWRQWWAVTRDGGTGIVMAWASGLKVAIDGSGKVVKVRPVRG